jgi:N-acetylglucosaminyl-diphospho-decaprenol L-rhamnosyltransferase
VIESCLTVIIVTYNSARHIDECLLSVEEQLPSDGSHIVVFDNASTDETPEIISTQWPKVRLIRSNANIGFGRACNEAVKGAETRYILLLNPDAVLRPGCLTNLVDLASRFPAAGLYGGRSFTPEGQPKYSCFGRLTLWTIWCNSTGLSQIFSRSRWLNPQLMGGWTGDTERKVAVISGVLLLVDRRAWERLGGFDERFFMYAEDSDLCLRAVHLGYSPIVTPDACVVHIGGASSTSKVNEFVMRYRGEVTLIRKIWSGPRKVIAQQMLVGGVLLRATLSRARTLRNLDSHHETGRWSQLWQRRQEWLGGW